MVIARGVHHQKTEIVAHDAVAERGAIAAESVFIAEVGIQGGKLPLADGREIVVAGQDKDRETARLRRAKLLGKGLVVLAFAEVHEIPGEEQKLRSLRRRVKEQRVDELGIVGHGAEAGFFVRVVGIKMQVGRDRDAQPLRLRQGRGGRCGVRCAAGAKQQHKA